MTKESSGNVYAGKNAKYFRYEFYLAPANSQFGNTFLLTFLVSVFIPKIYQRQLKQELLSNVNHHSPYGLKLEISF